MAHADTTHTTAAFVRVKCCLLGKDDCVLLGESTSAAEPQLSHKVFGSAAATTLHYTHLTPAIRVQTQAVGAD